MTLKRLLCLSEPQFTHLGSRSSRLPLGCRKEQVRVCWHRGFLWIVNDRSLAQIGVGNKRRFLGCMSESHSQVQCDPGAWCHQGSLHLVSLQFPSVLLPSQAASPFMMANGHHPLGVYLLPGLETPLPPHVSLVHIGSCAPPWASHMLGETAHPDWRGWV